METGVRSKFVTGMAWLSIAVSVLLGLLSGLELMAYTMLVSQPELAIQMGLSLQEQTGQFVDMERLPGQLIHQALMHAIFLVVGVPTSIGLLRRREWARKVTILLVAGVTLAMGPQLLWGDLPAQFPRWLTAAVFLLALLVHGDIVRRLMRPEIRAEFTS